MEKRSKPFGLYTLLTTGPNKYRRLKLLEAPSKDFLPPPYTL